MFKGYDPERRPPYTHIVYYVIGERIVKTTYTVCRGYGDSLSITSFSTKVDDFPEGCLVEVVK